MGAEALRPLTLAICLPLLRLRRPSENSLEELLSAAEKATLTYPEVSATRAEQIVVYVIRLVRDGDEWVAFVVRSFSRRVDPLARLGAPLARLAQTRVPRRYIEALKEALLAR